jgi:hypothetical protein
MISYAVIMDEQIPRLEVFFKRLMVDKDDDDGDNNSSGEYWEFICSDNVESWSLELLPMTARVVYGAGRPPARSPDTPDRPLRPPDKGQMGVD